MVEVPEGKIFGEGYTRGMHCMRNLSTNSVFVLELRKFTENLDRVGRSHDLPDAY
jgi:hypothetical protein